MAGRRASANAAFADSSPETSPGTAPAVIAGREVDETRGERLKRLARAIHHAIGTEESTKRSAREKFVRVVGPALMEVRDGELWRHGGFTSFQEWVNAEFGYSRPYAYALMDTVPVQAALSGIADTHINTSQVKVLAKVHNKAGADGVTAVWRRSLDDSGKTTQETLRHAAIELGYEPKPQRKPAALPPADDDDGIVDAEIVEDEERRPLPVVAPDAGIVQTLAQWAAREGADLGISPNKMLLVLAGALAESGGDIGVKSALRSRAKALFQTG